MPKKPSSSISSSKSLPMVTLINVAKETVERTELEAVGAKAELKKAKKFFKRAKKSAKQARRALEALVSDAKKIEAGAKKKATHAVAKESAISRKPATRRAQSAATT